MTSDPFISSPGVTSSATYFPLPRPPAKDASTPAVGSSEKPGDLLLDKLALFSPENYQINKEGYVTTPAGENVLGYRAMVSNGTYIPDLSAGATNPIVVPKDAISVMFAPDGSVNYEMPGGKVVTAGFIPLDESKQSGVNVYA
jgi:hypothetical protein